MQHTPPLSTIYGSIAQLELCAGERAINNEAARHILSKIGASVWWGCGWCSEIFASILEASSLALEIIIVTTIIVHPGTISAAEGITLWAARTAAAAATASSLLVLLRAIVVEA